MVWDRFFYSSFSFNSCNNFWNASIFNYCPRENIVFTLFGKLAIKLNIH